MINNGFYKNVRKVCAMCWLENKMFADSQSMACEGELSLICRSASRIAVLGVIDSKHDELEE